MDQIVKITHSLVLFSSAVLFSDARGCKQDAAAIQRVRVGKRREPRGEVRRRRLAHLHEGRVSLDARSSAGARITGVLSGRRLRPEAALVNMVLAIPESNRGQRMRRRRPRFC